MLKSVCSGLVTPIDTMPPSTAMFIFDLAERTARWGASKLCRTPLECQPALSRQSVRKSPPLPGLNQTPGACPKYLTSGVRLTKSNSSAYIFVYNIAETRTLRESNGSRVSGYAAIIEDPPVPSQDAAHDIAERNRSCNLLIPRPRSLKLPTRHIQSCSRGRMKCLCGAPAALSTAGIF